MCAITATDQVEPAFKTRTCKSIHPTVTYLLTLYVQYHMQLFLNVFVLWPCNYRYDRLVGLERSRV